MVWAPPSTTASAAPREPNERDRQTAGAQPRLVDRFRAIVGPAHALTDPDQQLPYVRELRDLYDGRAGLVLRPGSTEEVSKILALANEHGLPVVPQAGNTGLVGGQVPMNGEIVLSVSRLKNVRALDAQGFTMTVEAGMTLAEVHAAADGINRLFPLSLPSEGTCQIGGNLGTNAGGVGVLAYGNARQLVLGLEVVLADGRIWNGLNALKKDNTGYDLKDLFIGSEGTLGVITAATLKLFPKPPRWPPPSSRCPRSMPHSRCSASRRKPPARASPPSRSCARPPSRWSSSTPTTRATPSPRASLVRADRNLRPQGRRQRRAPADGPLETATERELLLDATIASSLTQQKDFWRLRESSRRRSAPKATASRPTCPCPRKESPSSSGAPTPPSPPSTRTRARSAQPLRRRQRALQRQPARRLAQGRFMEQWKAIAGAVHAIVLDFGGSISAEHGIGQMKRDELARSRTPSPST